MAISVDPLTMDILNPDPEQDPASIDTLRDATEDILTPPESRLEMPAQVLEKSSRVSFGWSTLATCLARILTFGGTIALTAYATRQMILIIGTGSVTPLQWTMTGLFLLTFLWIAFAACSALSGILFGGGRRVRLNSTLPKGKTALLMPVYNESPTTSFSALYAMARGLIRAHANHRFEIFVLSDTRDEEIARQEVRAMSLMNRLFGSTFAFWYRRRADNTARKAGNIHDFVERWGGRYDYMLILDADSQLSADTLTRMACEMDADSRCGILQSLPRLWNGNTLFARLQQFASMLYGPIVARGITAWQGDDGNYWGHNAIIRTSAFASAAGLPEIPGKKPFGGHILSHDFVEAALVRRAGWSVKMQPSLLGSWEESPPTLLDMAMRDRRWAQGNMQHLAVLKRTRGLRWPSRIHLLNGVMSYLASPIWLAMIVVGMVIAWQVSEQQVRYFSSPYQLFPDWPVFDSVRMLNLFLFTTFILLLPKCIGLISGFFRSDVTRACGPLTLTLSVVLELLFSVLYAPVFMLMQSKQIWEIFSGQDSGWSTQQRDTQKLAWGTILRRHWFHTVAGIALTWFLIALGTPLFYWMLPMTIGLILAIPLSALSSSKTVGKLLRKLHLLCIPEETREPESLVARQNFIAMYSDWILFEDELKALHAGKENPDLLH